ncbi:calcium-binding protein [Roseivivax sp.]
MFLAGLMGLMVVGSVAILSSVPGDDDGDELEKDFAADEAPPEEMPSGGGLGGDAGLAATEPSEAGGFDAAQSAGASPLAVAAQSLTLTDEGGLISAGSDDADALTGTEFTDHLDGGAGQDTLLGLGGDDVLQGQEDADQIEGGAGQDTLHGGAGCDLLSGGSGDDALFGHDGQDTLEGGAGADELQGGLGDDLLSGGSGDDALHGREGADVLSGGQGADTLFGGAGDDLLAGVDLAGAAGGAPTSGSGMSGAAGPDTGMSADGGESEVAGALGQDPASPAAANSATAPDADFLNGGDGADTLVLGDGDTGDGGAGADTFLTGHWMTGGGATVIDFDMREDRMVVVFDDAAGAPEDIGYSPDPESGDRLLLMSGEVILAKLPADEAPPIGDIVLMAASEAVTLAV